jgi:hypothetical protein
MVFPYRRALRARLIPFRYTDGIFLKATPGHDWEYKNQVAAGVNPAAKAALVQEFTRA